MRKSIIVIDDFYAFPEEVENFARNQEFVEDLRYYKGLRSVDRYTPNGLKEKLESIVGEPIDEISWGRGFNGKFQITTSNDPTVYHYDSQKWVGVLYLNKNAFVQSGTKTYQSNIDGARDRESCTKETFKYGFYDSTQFTEVDSIGNIYNRLVLCYGRLIHSAGPYWGDSKDTGRLVQLFFFN